MKGYRTILILLAYLGWLLGMALILRPPGGYTPELVASLASLAGTVGLAVVGLAGARVAKSYTLARLATPEDPA